MHDRSSRTQSELVWVLSVVAAIGGALAAVSPTGQQSVDRVLCAALVGFVTWAGSSARTWALLGVSGIAGVLAIPHPMAAAAALGAVAIVAASDLAGRHARWIKAVASALTALAALHLPLIVGFGGSAVAAGLLLVALAINGVRMKRRTVRRRVLWSTAGLFGLAVLAAGGSAATLLSARGHADDGERQIRAALDAVNGGQIDEATAALDDATASLAAAEATLGRPWGRLGAVVPVVAQHRALAIDLAATAQEAAVSAAAAIRDVDLDRVRLADGRFAVDEIARLNGPFGAVSDAVDAFAATLDERASPWLVEPLHDEIDRLADELDAEGGRVANLAEATRLVPDLLGGAEQRRFFVAFITPAEARPLGGHMANYAELALDDGRLTLSRFGRTGDLLEANDDAESRIITGPAAYLDRYGVFGAGGDGKPAGAQWWLNVTISPDFPSVAQVISELYENGTGREVDGVLAIDPTGLAGLLRVTGPIDVPSLGRQLTADNVVEFLQRQQYLLFAAGENEERADLLGDVARITFDAFLGSDDIDPVDLVQNLAPAVSAGHFLAWSPDADEQRLFAAVGAAGSFARQGPRDGLALTSLNSSANKIDVFLTRAVRYEAVVDEQSGALTGSVEVTLTNGAPADGLPAYVIGNAVDLPLGSNRTYLTLYRGGGIDGTTVDGAEVDPSSGTELGWNYAQQRLTLAPGSSTTLTYAVTGTVDPAVPYELLIRAQPLATPDQLTVSVTTSSGRQLLTFDGTLERTTILRSKQSPARG